MSKQEEELFVCGDRVAIFKKNYPEFGSVRWVGNLHNQPFMVGVEFDNPIGDDNNMLNGKFLFDAQPHHASVLPASVLSQMENVLDCVPPHYDIRKESPEPTLLGSDMTSMSTYHKMAFDQMSGGFPKSSHRNSQPMSGYNSERENWNILPNMTYTTNKNNIGNNKETLNDVKSTTKLRSKSYSRGISSLIDDKKPITSNNSAVPKPSSHITRDAPVNIGVAGGGSDESDSEFNDFSSNLKYHPYSHLSLHGIDQIEVITDEHISSPSRELSKEDYELGIGSLVEVLLKDNSLGKNGIRNYYGVIRWIGSINGVEDGSKIAGIEVEDEDDGICDGTLKSHRYFSCPTKKGMFVLLAMCEKDSRFIESLSSNPRASLAFGSTDCQPVVGNVPPLFLPEDVHAMFGKNKGIQGHQNSCYLDATLFSMFTFTSVFDSLLFRPPTKEDIIEYLDVQAVLRDEIVNPLRKNMFVRADRIMKLRKMLDNLSSVRGLTTEEKDPEEFLQSLLAQILKAEPFLQLSSGQEAYHYQLFVDKDDKLSLPSVQTLFDQSFLTSDIKLKQIPSCLIIQMPRFGKDYKMYDRILPSMVLDVTDVIEDSPRQCIICGKLAVFECRECYGLCGTGLESIAFCSKCMDKVHNHKKRVCHDSLRPLKVPPEFKMLADHCVTIPRVYMELFAVVCIETSHYVTFTRCGSGPEATWCFFDSMADRKGEQHGYNIPTVVECGELMQWVDEENSDLLHNFIDNKALPDLPRRLLCDAYLCFYQSPKVMMYR